MSIVEFLRARLDEDEVAAREAVIIRKRDYAHQPWVNDPDYTFKAWDDYPSGVIMAGPERVLREVEAKRQLLDSAAEQVGSGGVTRSAWADYVLESLAAVYADHPDYDPEWSKG